jgi:hypothetical protein
VPPAIVKLPRSTPDQLGSHLEDFQKPIPRQQQTRRQEIRWSVAVAGQRTVVDLLEN